MLRRHSKSHFWVPMPFFVFQETINYDLQAILYLIEWNQYCRSNFVVCSAGIICPPTRRTNLSNGDVSKLYSGNTWFEFRTGHVLSWLTNFVVVWSHSRLVQESTIKQTKNVSSPVLSYSSTISPWSGILLQNKKNTSVSEAVSTSETSVNICKAARGNFPEDSHLPSSHSPPRESEMSPGTMTFCSQYGNCVS